MFIIIAIVSITVVITIAFIIIIITCKAFWSPQWERPQYFQAIPLFQDLALGVKTVLNFVGVRFASAHCAATHLLRFSLSPKMIIASNCYHKNATSLSFCSKIKPRTVRLILVNIFFAWTNNNQNSPIKRNRVGWSSAINGGWPDNISWTRQPRHQRVVLFRIMMMMMMMVVMMMVAMMMIDSVGIEVDEDKDGID